MIDLAAILERLRMKLAPLDLSLRKRIYAIDQKQQNRRKELASTPRVFYVESVLNVFDKYIVDDPSSPRFRKRCSSLPAIEEVDEDSESDDEQEHEDESGQNLIHRKPICEILESRNNPSHSSR